MFEQFRRLGSCAAGLGALAFGLGAPAHAQVIEIGDDGEARTYSHPASFVGDHGIASSASAARVPAADRFERAAKAEGVDVKLLRAVAWTESRGRQNAVSPKGALGIMQLMPGTAAALGVNPLDADANVRGGARYLARQLARFQSVPLALAAYNAGPGAVLRWGGVPPYAETRFYVAQIMSRYQPTAAPTQLRPSTKRLKTAAAPANLLLIEVPSL